MPNFSYHGVTLTVTNSLGGSITSGAYVTGEPYIVLPATGVNQVTVIDNPSNQDYGACAVVGGAMLNPVPLGTQGYSDHYVGTNPATQSHCYASAKNAKLSLPLTVANGNALTVAILRTDEPANKVPFYKIVVFMFVTSAPAANSFRPGFYGTDRTLAFNESDIEWDRLANYPRAGMTQVRSQAYMEDDTRFPALPWHEWGPGWEASKVRPQYNTANTNAENTAQFSAQRFGDAAMWLNLDWTRAQKRKLALRIIQNGIDMGSYFLMGGNMQASGSHQTGWKSPLFMAAILLQDSRLLGISRDPDNFVEGNLTTWRITESDIGRTVDSGLSTFDSGDVGKYWWGISHRSEPNKDNSDFPAAYQAIFGEVVPTLLASRMMGAESEWGWGIAFRYAEEHIDLFGIGTGFFSEVYNLVNPGLPPIESVTVSPPSVANETIQEAEFGVQLSNPWNHPMRYTTNGSDPTESSPLYSTPVTVSASATIKAKCFPSDGQDPGSIMSTAIGVITNGTPAPPRLKP